LAPATVTETVALDVPIGPTRHSALVYTVGADPWQQFDVSGTSTGGQTVAWFDPATAYGRLDNVTTSAGSLPPDSAPLFSHAYPTGGGAFGRIVIDDPATYFIKVTATNPMTNPHVTATFTKRADAVDLGTVTSAASRTGDTIDQATPMRFYLFHAAAGASVTITVTPTSNVNTQFRRLAADETPRGPLSDAETFVQGAGGWTAFVVSAAGGLPSPRTFDVNVVVQ